MKRLKAMRESNDIDDMYLHGARKCYHLAERFICIGARELRLSIKSVILVLELFSM